MGRTAIRLTRRGRFVVFCCLLAIAGGLVALAAAPGQAADPPSGPQPTVIVQPGDTLWSIATRTKGREGRDATVEEIRRLNNLSGYDIDTGQRLILPRRR